MCCYVIDPCSLSAYQTEIDNLTKRSKISENAFLSLYKKLAEAPDPYPLLDAAVVRPGTNIRTRAIFTFQCFRSKQ